MFLQTLFLNENHIGDNGASTIADLMKTLPHLQNVYLSHNHIGGTGAALLWNQSIHKCCNYLDLDYNVIDNDVFISALSGAVNNGYKGNKFCQLEVSVIHIELQCSDLRDIRTIRKQLPKGIRQITDGLCLEMSERIFKRLKYYLGEYHQLYSEGRVSMDILCCLHPPHFLFN